MNPIKVIRDKYGIKLKYPYRSCKECSKYPCFENMDKCISNFASYGCFLYSNKNN